jgi:hypothetical protein
MKYHAKIEMYREAHLRWNMSKEATIQDILLPFINGSIIPVGIGTSHAILNMKAVLYLRIYKTEHDIEVRTPAFVPDPMEMYAYMTEENECTDEVLNEIRQTRANVHLTSLLEKVFAEPKKQVFVIMKFGDKHLDSAYEGVIKPLIKEFGYTPLRIDEVQDSGKITDQVLEAIATSRYVLADLSGERPNCYYESGFSHALGKEIIFTIRKSDPIHFDLAGYRFIQWDTEAELRARLRERMASLESAAQWRNP